MLWQVREREGSVSGQAEKVGTVRTRKTRTTKNRSMEQHASKLDKTNWQQADRKHRYKYTGDNGNKWEPPGGGGDKHKTGETDQCVT
jgi:hypothetical protein